MFCLSAANWWERSPNSSNSTNFCKVNSNGNANNNNASNTNGLAPFGYICFGRRSSESEIKAMKNEKIQGNNNRGESRNCAVVCTSEETAAAGAPHTAPTINNVISFDKILQAGIACAGDAVESINADVRSKRAAMGGKPVPGTAGRRI